MDTMMNIADIEKINKVLESMVQYESSMSDFYKQCADAWTDDRAFWQDLSNAEAGHAANIQKIGEMIARRMASFDMGRPFNPIALNTAMAGLAENSKRLSSGAVSMEQLLITARDIEQSILESHYAEIVKTADLEYQTLMKQIVADTYLHRKMIQDRMDALKSKR
jgi:hypothetical protein